MAVWVLHVLSILAVVALRSRVSNFLTSLLSLRAWTRWNGNFIPFPHLLGSLSVRALWWTTNSSGVSPALIHTSSNWYIQHHWDRVWSIWDAKWFRKDFVFFLVVAISSVVTLVGVYWFHFWQPVVPGKFSSHSRKAPLSSGSSDLPADGTSSPWNLKIVWTHHIGQT